MNKLSKREYYEILELIKQTKFEATMLFNTGVLFIIAGVFLTIQIGVKDAIPLFAVSLFSILASWRIWKSNNISKKLLDKFEPYY